MEYVKLGEVATFINGYAFKPSDWKKEGIPIIRIQNLTGNNREINYYQGKIDEKYHVKKGEILISWSASIDVYEWKGENGYLNQHIFKVVFDKMDIDKDFFVYLIKNKLNEIKKYTHGSTMKHITKSKFDNIKIRIPSKEEQIKIANKLNKIIIIIEKQKEQLELLENLKKSQFFELFGDPIKNEKGWEKVKLEKICDVRDGTHDSPKYILEGYPLVTSKNIINDSISFENVNYISETDYQNINKRSKVEYGDILMPMIGTIGKPIIVKIEDRFAIKNLALIKFYEGTKVLNIYVKSLLESNFLEIEIQKNKRGGTQKFIALKDIRNLKIPIPPLELQNKFATKIEAIQKLKFEIEKSLKETENLYNSLMQKFFSNK